MTWGADAAIGSALVFVVAVVVSGILVAAAAAAVRIAVVTVVVRGVLVAAAAAAVVRVVTVGVGILVVAAAVVVLFVFVGVGVVKREAGSTPCNHKIPATTGYTEGSRTSRTSPSQARDERHALVPRGVAGKSAGGQRNKGICLRAFAESFANLFDCALATVRTQRQHLKPAA